ncbi:hypothetical protein KAT36_04695 [Candidatus Pacearchaeota archaeon]|nr:hypothetical protein [Candidatus Pacearchaeota archaeon]
MKNIIIGAGEKALDAYSDAIALGDRASIDIAFSNYKNTERDYYFQTKTFFPEELERRYSELVQLDGHLLIEENI